MNDTLLKLTEEKKAELVTKLADIAIQKLFTDTKDASETDSGRFKFIISTNNVDRQGESVDQLGWDLAFYKMNPVVLWAHDYSALPIGVTTEIGLQDGKLVAEGKFAPADANPFAQQVRKLYDLGMVCASSVGFIPKEFDQKQSGVIAKAELLEFSLVPVPANPYAVSMRTIKELSLDVGFLKTKGIEIVEKSEETAEEKSTIQEEINDVQVREEKWKNYMRVSEVMDAFCSAYFDEETPVENFKPLVKEMADILSGLSGDETAEKAVPEAVQKLLGNRVPISKSVEKSIEALKGAVENITKNFALGSLVRADGKSGDVRDDEAEINKGRKTSNGLVELDNFLEARAILRSVDNGIEKVLHSFNEAAKKHK